MGPVGQRTPHVIETRTEQAALLYWRGQSSPMANLPAVTSSHGDLLDLAHLLHYLVGPLVGASDYGGGYGGAEVRVDGEMLVEATVTQSNACTRIDTRLRSYCTH